MSWKVSCVMDERMKFIVDCQEDEWSMAETCRQYGISRKTGYKWLHRYATEGVSGLEERSRAPHTRPNVVDPKIEDAIVKYKGKHMKFGPKKIRVKLLERYPWEPWPAVSTIGEILDRHGLVVHRRKRNKATPSAKPLSHCKSPNDVWCVDFKGWFCTGDGKRCDPLTISDGDTRFLLRCHGMTGRTGFVQVKPLFETTFREFGMPLAIRSDNGPPFATVGLGGLSKLAIWWIRLGIKPERIRPGRPQENGRHERMHRTLKEYTLNPPKQTVREQQHAFDEFRKEYNFERPHEALGQKPPADFYEHSQIEFPSKLPDLPPYPTHWETRKVCSKGLTRLHGQKFYISRVVSGQWIGFEPIDDGLWKIHFTEIPLALFDERKGKIGKLPKEKK